MGWLVTGFSEEFKDDMPGTTADYEQAEHAARSRRTYLKGRNLSNCA